MRASLRLLALLAAAQAAACLLPAGVRGQAVQCGRCHADRAFLVGKGTAAAPESLLFVPDTILEGTVHATLRCADCHRAMGTGYPHPAGTAVVPCATCHERQGKDWDASIHAANAHAWGDAPTCVACHGSHLVYGAKDPRSPINHFNVAALCGRCHADPRIIGRYFAGPENVQARVAAFEFPKSVHGAALTRAGLVVSATCTDCHRAHRVLPASDARSSVSRDSIPATCGRCHAGVASVYDSSAHGPDYAGRATATEADHPRPVCVDCHTAHAIVRADQPRWQLGTVQTCGHCHERLYDTYFETYHGKVTQLGYALAARCNDCHTAHNMRPASDPRSSVFAGNLVVTCGRCHPGANANFVKYYPHGDPKQRTKYPLLFWPWIFMTALLVGVMGFFLLHTALWVTRVGIGRLRGDRSSSGGHS